MAEDLRLTREQLDGILEERYQELASAGKLRDIKHVIAIERGGTYPASFLLKKMPGIGRSSVTISFYDDRELTRTACVSINESDRENWKQYGPGEILVVDDLADTGATFVEFEKHYDGPPFKSFVIFQKPRTRYRPTFYCREAPDNCWIIFPPP